MSDTANTAGTGTAAEGRDDTVLDMRSSGASFSRIAKTVGFDTAREANDAFHRALGRRPASERRVICDAESARLDALEQRVRGDAAVEPADREKRLRAITRLRTRLTEA